MKLVSGFCDLIVARLPRRPAAYFLLFFTWAVTLWFLSASNPAPKDGPDIPHLDKVAHFLYFFGGGALLAAFGGQKWPGVSRTRLFLVVALICCVIGRLDEYHQGFTPGRSGNDTGDWLADILGGVSGALAVIGLILPRIRRDKGLKAKKASENTEI
ncbi:MAG: VanZ family protein [Akkermansiaceae bacterium]|nr:VanZ family protein [Akkermansiaceae bacterium]